MDTFYQVAIIPARAGSKRLPSKNTRMLNGRPMIEWTILAAIEANCFDTIVVTSDDPNVWHIAADHKVVLIKRDPELAGDDIHLDVVIGDVVQKLGLNRTCTSDGCNELDDVVITLLQPTSPLRTAAQIGAAQGAFLDSGATTLISVCELEKPLNWTCSISDGELIPIYSFKHMNNKMPPAFRPNGAIYILYLEHLLDTNGSFADEEGTMAFIMSRRSSVDVDTWDDFIIASAFLSCNNITFDVIEEIYRGIKDYSPIKNW